ncbi:MAG: hypothetical protein H6733_03230 [Alphaproteobacteria bacterium]|nr:hypothetical protein [Alphaproteobacteria bacterium]
MSDHYCFCIAHPPQAGAATGRAALLLRTQWDPNTSIKIAFLGGSAALQTRVMAAARRWLDETGISLSFQRVPAGAPSDIRIAFVQGAGSWSYLGTDCKTIAPGQPTMNYGWLTDASTDREVQQVVLHEFGHALGLIHEHQTPFDEIQWDKAAVYADLSGPPNHWDKATIDFNMFETYAADDVQGSARDPKSIMHYPIPAAWTGGTAVVGDNDDLSPTDKRVIRKLYA